MMWKEWTEFLRSLKKKKDEPCIGVRANLLQDGTCIIKKSNGFMNPEFCTCKEEEE